MSNSPTLLSRQRPLSRHWGHAKGDIGLMDEASIKAGVALLSELDRQA
jgi:hypothetical protein